jgi:hypothetical protein
VLKKGLPAKGRGGGLAHRGKTRLRRVNDHRPNGSHLGNDMPRALPFSARNSAMRTLNGTRLE